METNEVRIGNYILDKKDENVEYVYLIQDLGDTVYINDLHPENCIPIPLTEKWLLSFGFFPSPGFEGQNYDPNDELEIEFVHQFQNVFFALKGKELILK